MGADSFEVLVGKLEDVLRFENVSFDDLIRMIEICTRMSKVSNELRDRALVKADLTGPYADRRAMGEAAGLMPSSLYRILERNGRPRNRRKQGASGV